MSNPEIAIEMERIELFDKYIKGELPEEESNKLKALLDSNEGLATKFLIYSMTVVGICKEAEQEDIEFGKAMKSLSKEELFKAIRGKTKTPEQGRIAACIAAGLFEMCPPQPEISAMAALDKIEDDIYVKDNSDDEPIKIAASTQDETSDENATSPADDKSARDAESTEDEALKQKEEPNESSGKSQGLIMFLLILIALLVLVITLFG